VKIKIKLNKSFIFKVYKSEISSFLCRISQDFLNCTVVKPSLETESKFCLRWDLKESFRQVFVIGRKFTILEIHCISLSRFRVVVRNFKMVPNCWRICRNLPIHNFKAFLEFLQNLWQFLEFFWNHLTGNFTLVFIGIQLEKQIRQLRKLLMKVLENMSSRDGQNGVEHQHSNKIHIWKSKDVLVYKFWYRNCDGTREEGRNTRVTHEILKILGSFKIFHIEQSIFCISKNIKAFWNYLIRCLWEIFEVSFFFTFYLIFHWLLDSFIRGKFIWNIFSSWFILTFKTHHKPCTWSRLSLIVIWEDEGLKLENIFSVNFLIIPMC